MNNFRYLLNLNWTSFWKYPTGKIPNFDCNFNDDMLRIKEVYVHIIIWLCLVSFPMAVNFAQFGTIQVGFLPRVLLTPCLTYVNYLVFVPRILLKKKLWQYLLVSVLTLFLFNLVLNSFFMESPLKRLELFVGNVDQTTLRTLSETVTAIVTLSFYLLGGVMGLTKDFYRREKLSQTREVNRKETELQFLRAQLNPHFLFNSLNSIYSLVRNKSSEAPHAVITLSELMRYMLYEAKKELVPLGKEIEYIQNFVQLQILRLTSSENVKTRITGDYDHKLIAPLLLIPFVENAFKYGTDFKGNTHVDIQMKIVSDTLFFEVCNTIGPYKRDLENSGIGLENIKHRLHMLYPNEHALRISRTDGKYQVNLEVQLSC
ncbi:MAG: histidine kinase [Bacteroidota bacterium]